MPYLFVVPIFKIAIFSFSPQRKKNNILFIFSVYWNTFTVGLVLLRFRCFLPTLGRDVPLEREDVGGFGSSAFDVDKD